MCTAKPAEFFDAKSSVKTEKFKKNHHLCYDKRQHINR